MEGDFDAVRLKGIVETDNEEDQSDGDEAVLIESTNEIDTETKPYYCGFLCCRPKFLQVFANKKVFTFLLFLFALVEGSIVSGFTSIVLSSLEKRYNFTSTAVGFVAVSYDTVAIFAAIIVSYLGGRHGSHKPRWLGTSMILIGIGSFIFASPQFLFGPYKAGPSQNSTLEQCEDNRNFTTVCSSANDIAYAVYLFGNVFIASGAASMYTLGPAFIDKIVLPSHVSLHIAVYQVGSLIGPAVGYGLGSAFLSVYVDPWEQTTLQPSDPAWVGGWWICFIFSGVSSFLLSIPFLMYPKALSDSHIVRQAREKEMAVTHTTRSGPNERSFLNTVKHFAVQTKQLLTNMPFMFQSFSVAVLFIVVTGLVSFGPKYFEVQFHFSAAASGLLAGGVAITSASTGVVCGSLVIHFTKWRGRKLAGFITIILVIVLFATPVFLVTCTSIDVAGITTSYANGSSNGVDGASCNSGCGCTSSVYEPVCGDDGITYFSPCRAGCRGNHGDEHCGQLLQ